MRAAASTAQQRRQQHARGHAAARGRRMPRVVAYRPAYFPPAAAATAAAGGAVTAQTPTEAPPQQPAAASGSAAAGVQRVPLDFYAALGVNRSAAREAVRRAYEHALASPPDVGYSQDTLFSRAVLLRDAAECLADLDSRRDYEVARNAGAADVAVSPEALPGALALLQEAGNAPLVLELGGQWLAMHPHDALGRDVAAAMALAHCSLAAAALERDTTVSEACHHLEAALQLLRRARSQWRRAPVAPQLQQQLLQTLEELSPRFCHELLALPLDSPARPRGLALLHKLATLPPDLSPLGADRDDFLHTARGVLTAQEQLALYRGVGPSSCSTQQRLDAALAAVGVAYQHCQPLLLLCAAQMYQQLQEEAAKEGRELDVSVERAACAMLLGDAQEALALLQLSGEGSAGAVDDSIKAYVLTNSPDGTDLLPGVLALTQAWLDEAALGSFRHEEQQLVPDLAAWYSSLGVQLFIRVHMAVKQLLAVLHAIPAVVAAVFAAAWQRMSADGEQRRADDPASAAAAAVAAAPSIVERTSAQHEVQDEGPVQLLTAAEAASPSPQPLPDAAAGQHEAADQRSHPARLHLARRHSMPAAANAPASAERASPEAAAASAVPLPAREATRPPRGASPAARFAPAAANVEAAAGAEGEEEEEEGVADEDDVPPATRAAMASHLAELEAAMWDTAPEPSSGRAFLRLALGACLLAGCACVLRAARPPAPAASAPGVVVQLS